jgi:hypothetical protein
MCEPIEPAGSNAACLPQSLLLLLLLVPPIQKKTAVACGVCHGNKRVQCDICGGACCGCI